MKKHWKQIKGRRNKLLPFIIPQNNVGNTDISQKTGCFNYVGITDVNIKQDFSWHVGITDVKFLAVSKYAAVQRQRGP